MSIFRVFPAVIAIGSVAIVSACSSAGTSQVTPGSAGAGASAESAMRIASERPAGSSSSISVTSLSDAGPGTLRSAIDAVNSASAGSSSKITFAVSGTIVLKSNLPSIRNTVKIDGTTAPNYASSPVVEINANHHGGLIFTGDSNGSQLLGIAIGNATGEGVVLDSSAITLNLNYIGLDRAGKALGNTGDGVFVSPVSTKDQIGLNASGAAGVVANVISANGGNGISLTHSRGNTIAANRIGTNPAGTMAIGNHGNGILLTEGSRGNEIGGTAYTDSATGAVNNPTGDKGTVTPVFVVPPDGNLVSGNFKNGILIDKGSTKNVLNGNFIGTTANGNTAIGNHGDGVDIDRSDDNSLIGCKFVNNPFVYYNVSSGNGGNGVHVTDSYDVTIQGNFFGIGANNTNIVANSGDGILIDGVSKNTTVGGVIPLGNVSAGNALNGIEVTGAASGFITFNTFGGLLAFKGAAPNGNDGVLITATGGNQTVRTNVLSGNYNNGLEIAGNASGVTVDPNIIGLNTNGSAVLANGKNGVLIDGNAHDNIVGGDTQSVIPQNTFSGNFGYGIAIEGKAYNNHIFNSYIGTDVLGVFALANNLGGVYVGGSATNNLIGGLTTASTTQRNLISGNTGNGVSLGGFSKKSRVLNNWIGIDRTGKHKLPNTGAAIFEKLTSTDNTILGNVTKPQ